MRLSANILFQIELRHSYFKDGLVKGLTCFPTKSGKLQLDKLQAHVHAFHGGLAAVNPQSGTKASPSPRIAESNIAFALKVSDPDFVNFTALQDLPAGFVLYGNNLGDPKRAADLSAIQVKGPQFTLNFGPLLPADLGSERHLKITRPNGAVVLEQDFVTRANDTQCMVNLLNESDGQYTVAYTAANKTVETTFFKCDAGLEQSVLGFFEWFGRQGGSAQAARPLAQKSTLQFERLNTVWQYYLVNKNNLSFQNPSISPVKVGHQMVHFVQTASDVLLPNGKRAVEFTSDHALPLEESPKMKIFLEVKGLVKDMKLPYAVPDLMYETHSTTMRNSKIYVYF